MAAVPEYTHTYSSILYAKAIKNISSNFKQLSLNTNKESQRFPLIVFQQRYHRLSLRCDNSCNESWGQLRGWGGGRGSSFQATKKKQISVKCQLSTYGFLLRVLLLRNIAWTSNLDQKVRCRQGYKYLKSHGAADKNTSAMEILAYNCECQLSTVGTHYRHTVYFQYSQLSSLGALSSQRMQSKSKKIIQKIY